MSEKISDTIAALDEREKEWLSEQLGRSIANLGHPVGCGIAPPPELLDKAACTLFDRYCLMIRMAVEAAEDRSASRIRELEGEVATWQERADLLAAEINAGRADLDAALADNECLRVALKRISDTPSKMIWGESSEVLEAMHAMEALADAALKGETNGN